jgi:putative transposase
VEVFKLTQKETESGMAKDRIERDELASKLLATAEDAEDPLRAMAEMIADFVMEAEVTEKVGAAPHERSEERTTHRNGHRERTLSTKAGDLELRIPKLRSGSFFPSLLEPRRRIDRALWAVVMEAYVHGVSTRKVDDLVAALGLDAGISKSEVSRICKELDGEMAAFRDRPLGHVEFPYVFADATYVKARVGGRVVSKAIVIGRYWASPWATPRTGRSGRPSCAPCGPGGSPVSSWSSPTPTRA